MKLSTMPTVHQLSFVFSALILNTTFPVSSPRLFVSLDTANDRLISSAKTRSISRVRTVYPNQDHSKYSTINNQKEQKC